MTQDTTALKSSAQGVPRLRPGSKIYLMGICGTGMAALAGLLKEKGFNITGSDSGFYPPMNQVLEKLLIPVYKGYNPDNIRDAAPDMVIIGNVIRATNPEAVQVMEQDIPFMSFPQALGEFFLHDRNSLVVAGTHGKTTTSAMLVSALKGCGARPGFLIGGVVTDAGRGFEKGEPPWFVIEGDEYDTAFFDKVSKFLHYKPKNAIITSMEFDHADIFKDFSEIQSSFERFVKLLPGNGILVACADWPAVMKTAEKARCASITYGFNQDADWMPEKVCISRENTTYLAVNRQQDIKIPVTIRAPGRHNVLNSLSVLALCHALSLDIDGVVAGLRECQGVKRRQEIRGVINGITIIDDFAHHPRAVSETLAALKERFIGQRLVAVFEPRTNTSRRNIFQDDYAQAFSAADRIIVREVPEPEKFSGLKLFSSKQLAEDLKMQGKDAECLPDASAIITSILGDAKPGDVYAILSNGPFENIHQRLMDSLKKTGETRR